MSFPKLGNMVTTISDVSQYNLQWSFGPLVNLMRPFGIDFNVARQRSSIRLIFLRILGISSAIYAITVGFIQMKSDCFPENDSEKPKNPTVKSDQFQGIMVYNLYLLMELRLLMSAIINWEPLWKAAQDMEKRLRFCSSFYQRLRKISLTLALAFLVFVSQKSNMKWYQFNQVWSIFQLAAETFIVTHKHYVLNGGSVLDLAWIPSCLVMEAHQFCFIVLFTWFMCLASMGIEVINQQVQTRISAPQENQSAHIKKWRQDYGYVYRFTEEINRSSSHCLVMIMALLFLMISFYPYKLYSKWNKTFTYKIQHLWKMVSVIIILLLLVYIPRTLRNKVNTWTRISYHFHPRH